MSQRSVTDSKALKALENRLHAKLAAIEARFTKELERTDLRLEGMRSAIKNHVLATPALTVSKRRAAAGGPKAAYRS